MSKWLKIDSGVRKGCIMSPCLFNVYMDGVIQEREDGGWKEGREIPGVWERVEIVWPLVCR